MRAPRTPSEADFEAFRTEVGATNEESLEAFLAAHNYRILQELGCGEGHTSDVFKVLYDDGSIVKERVAKVAKATVQHESPTTRMNFAGRDPHAREREQSNRISHPNIVEVLQAYEFNGRAIHIMPYLEGFSLTERVRMGPITDAAELEKVFAPVLAALKHLHVEEELVHRDVKPGNIILPRMRDGLVQLTDLQTVGSLDSLTHTAMPTRGGTANTRPDILNDLIAGRKPSKDKGMLAVRNDLYGLGVSMYYAMTGNMPFSYTLDFDSRGTQFEIGGETIRAALKVNGVNTQAIDLVQHEEDLGFKLRDVPSQYRKLLKMLMSAKPLADSGSFGGLSPAYGLHADVREAFDDAMKPRRSKALAEITKYVKRYAIVAGMMTGLVGGVIATTQYNKRNPPKEPAPLEFLTKPAVPGSSIEYLLGEENVRIPEFAPRFAEVRAYATQMDEDYDIEFLFLRESESRSISQRLLHSVARSLAVERKNFPASRDNTRTPITRIRKEFIYQITRFPGELNISHLSDPLQEHFWLVRQVQACLPQINASDVLSCYFVDKQEWFNSMRAANSLEYFPKEGSAHGYGEFLPEAKKRMIDRALAFYAVTDMDGKIHPEAIPTNLLSTNPSADLQLSRIYAR